MIITKKSIGILIGAVALVGLAMWGSQHVPTDYFSASIAGPGFVEGYDYERNNRGKAKVMVHNGEKMVLTEIVANTGHNNGDRACARIIGANGQPMVCKNNVESFPYLENDGCKLFHPGAAERISTFPGHGAHGGHYDIFCDWPGLIGTSGTCSATGTDTCTTCPACAKNLDCSETINTFSNSVIGRCYESIVAAEDALVTRISFDDPSSYTFDSSGNGSHGVNHGANFSNQGCKTNSCAEFNGGTDYIDADGVYSLTSDMSAAIWVKANRQPTTGARIFDIQQQGNVGVNVYFDAGRIVLDNGGGPQAVLPSGFGFEDDRWHHVGVTRAGNVYTLYVDGQVIGTRTGVVLPYQGFTLGRWSTSSSPLDGALDEFYVFNKALTGDEMRKVMNQGLPPVDFPTPGAAEIQPEPPVGPIASSITVNDTFIALVTQGQTGTQACAALGKACLGYTDMNRAACLALFPTAATKNENAGGKRDFFCQSGTLQSGEPCVNTVRPTCATCASCSPSNDCNAPLQGVDAAFAECVDPFSPEVLEIGLPYQGELNFNPVTGQIEGHITISHPHNEITEAKIEFSTDTGETMQQATIADASTTPGEIELTEQEYQIQSIDTDVNESIELTFYWDAEADGLSLGDQYLLKVSIRDRTGNISFQATDIKTISEGPTHGAAGITSSPPGDRDGDGIPDEEDDDIDGDGIPNEDDETPEGETILDTDFDGIPDDQDSDLDGDGISNALDDDIDGDGIPNGEDDDVDGDGIPNGEDDDVDGDGTTNGADGDIDGDGEDNITDNDIDGDRKLNGVDNDIDGDGRDNGEDDDIDGDGFLNGEDGDVDGDGRINSEDDDIDGDGLLNEQDGDRDGDQQPNDDDENPSAVGISVGISEVIIEESQARNIDCFEITQQEGLPCTQDEIADLLASIENNQFIGKDAELEKAQFIQDYLSGTMSKLAPEDRKALFGADMDRAKAIELIIYMLYRRGVVTEEQLNATYQQTYPDVPPSHPFFLAIEIATALGIVGGYPDGTFGPHLNPNVAEIARMVAKSMALLSTDVKKVLAEETANASLFEHWYQQFIDTLQRFGVFSVSDLTSFVSGIELVDILQDIATGAGIEKPLTDVEVL